MPTPSTPGFFEANEAFATHLLAAGFKDVTTAINQHKGKRQFRDPNNRNREVYFDYIHLKLRHGNGYDWDGYRIPRAAFDFWAASKLTKPNKAIFKTLLAQ